jgi:hypothetical protein
MKPTAIFLLAAAVWAFGYCVVFWMSLFLFLIWINARIFVRIYAYHVREYTEAFDDGTWNGLRIGR